MYGFTSSSVEPCSCRDSRASSGLPGFSKADWWPHHPTLPTAPTAPSKTPAALHRICDALIRATETNASSSFSPFSCLPLLGFFLPPSLLAFSVLKPSRKKYKSESKTPGNTRNI